MLERDHGYEQLLFGTEICVTSCAVATAATLGTSSIKTSQPLLLLRDKNHDFVSLILTSLEGCISEHFNLFHSPAMLLSSLKEALPIYTDIVTKKNKTFYSPRDLAKALRQAAYHLALDMAALSDSKAPCAEAWVRIESIEADTRMDFVLPYTAIGLAYLYYASGEFDAAALEVAGWLDDQYSPAALLGIEECNRQAESACDLIGYKVADVRQTLPLWYKLRAQYVLSLILESTEAARARRKVFEESLITLRDIFRGVFKGTKITKADDWATYCTLENRDLTAEQLTLEERLVAVYIGMADKLLYYTARDARTAPLGETLITPDLLALGKQNTQVNLDCFPAADMVWTVPRESLEASFLTQYGTALAVSAIRARPVGDAARAEGKETLKLAQRSLERAVYLLGSKDMEGKDVPSREREHDKVPNTLAGGLFYAAEAQDTLRSAELELDEVKDALSRY
jgi:hypothetical protein